MSPRTSARVVRSVSAEPACGSDIDTATWISPRHTAGTTRCFSDSDAEPFDGAHRADAGFEHREADGGGNLAELLEHQQRLEIAEAEAAVAVPAR